MIFLGVSYIREGQSNSRICNTNSQFTAHIHTYIISSVINFFTTHYAFKFKCDCDSLSCSHTHTVRHSSGKDSDPQDCWLPPLNMNIITNRKKNEDCNTFRTLVRVLPPLLLTLQKTPTMIQGWSSTRALVLAHPNTAIARVGRPGYACSTVHGFLRVAMLLYSAECETRSRCTDPDLLQFHCGILHSNLKFSHL